jgi:hypothetical protein
VRTELLCILAIAGNPAAQTLVVDRGLPSGIGFSQPMEREGKGFLGDSFRVGAGGKTTSTGGLWQIDFQNVRWPVPGGMDVLFSVRGFARPKASCGVSRAWSLSASAASSGYRLRGFDKDAVPEGFAESTDRPLSINVQVWADRASQ